MMPPMYAFPAHDLERPGAFKARMSSFWTSFFKDQDGLDAYLRVFGRLMGQLYLEYDEAAKCHSRQLTPIHHRESCRSVVLALSGRGRVSPRYDDAGLTHDAGLTYDGPLDVNRPVWEWPGAPARLAALADSVDRPSTLLVEGVDFTLSAGRLEFAADPFERLDTDPAGDDDETITLFAMECDEDRHHVRDHWGYVVGLEINESSREYKDTVNAVLDAVTAGPSVDCVRRVLEAAAGSPLAAADETVEEVALAAGGPVVVTDKNAYPLGDAAEVAVAAGDVLAPGDALSDRLGIHDLNRGVKPPVPALVLGNGLVLTGGQVTFRDTDVALEVLGAYAGGAPKVRFELGGHPLVLEAFWDEVDRQSEASGVTIAHYLTGLESPAATDLDPFVNPMEFACRHVLRWAASVALVRPVGLNLSRRVLLGRLGETLRRVVPAEGVVLVIVEAATLYGTTTAPDGVLGSADPAEPLYGDFPTPAGRLTAAPVRGVFL